MEVDLVSKDLMWTLQMYQESTSKPPLFTVEYPLISRTNGRFAPFFHRRVTYVSKEVRFHWTCSSATSTSSRSFQHVVVNTPTHSIQRSSINTPLSISISIEYMDIHRSVFPPLLLVLLVLVLIALKKVVNDTTI